MPKTLAVKCMAVTVWFAAGVNQAFANTGGAASAGTTLSTAAKPPAEMSALYPRIGKWNVVIRTEPSNALPKGGLDRGVMTMTRGPGGFSVVQDFWSRGSSGNFVGQSYEWWDTREKTYKFVWCDNSSGCIQMDTVIVGNTWTNEMDSVDHGQKIHTVIRAEISADHNAIHEEARSSYDGGPYQSQTVSDYTRISPDAK